MKIRSDYGTLIGWLTSGFVAGMLALAPVHVFAQQDATSAGATVLFDGDHLDHWRGYQSEEIGSGWKIDNGILKFDGSGGGDIVTRRKFSDFDLRFEWAVTPGANSGVMYKVGLGDSAPYLTGPEYQILDDEKHSNGSNELTAAAALYGLYPATGSETKPVGQWNTARIVVHGERVQHWLNDKLVVDVVVGSEDWNQRVADSKFAEWEKFASLDSGHICLQDHGNEVWFRNIVIRPPLKTAPKNHGH